LPCPPGLYRSMELAECTECVAGYFCSGGNRTKCTNRGEYCPKGSRSPLICPKGSYCSSSAAAPTLCTPGQHYCPTGSMSPRPCPKGATCTIPASPELVLTPGRFDVLESEVLNLGGKLRYNLSLSAKPSEFVQVSVILDATQATCYKYGPKFTLASQAFEFHQNNYSTPQTVVLFVERLNESRYEGVFSASLQHSIISSDEDYQSAFLRPALVSLQDDSDCPENAQKYEENRIRRCGCTEGHYIKADDPKFCNSVVECGKCPSSMVCNNVEYPTGQILEKAEIQPHWFRLHNNSLTVVKCPEPSIRCKGGATHGNALCMEGHIGVMCMICEIRDDIRYVKSGKRCVKCDGNSIAGLCVAVAIVVLLSIGAILFLARKKKRHQIARDPDRKEKSDQYGGTGDFASRVQTQYKILVTFTQVLNKVVTIYPIKLPPVFESFWANLDFLSFDLSVLPVNCIWETNFHDRLLFVTVGPFVVVCGISTAWWVLQKRLRWKGGEDMQASLAALSTDTIRLVIMFLFTVFPMVSTTIFQTFQYDARLNDGSAYLIVDYTIKRGDSTHSSYVAYASIMGALYCFGIPAASWVALRRKKELIKKLQLGTFVEFERGNEGIDSRKEEPLECNRIETSAEEATRRLPRPDQDSIEAKMRIDDPLLFGLSPLYQDYQVEYWWFEIPKFVSTLIFSALATMLPVEGASQVFVSLMVSAGMVVLFAYTRPYIDFRDNVLAQFCQMSLSFTLAVGLLELASAEFQDALFGPILVVCTSLNLLVGFGVIVVEFLVVTFPKTAETWTMRFHTNQIIAYVKQKLDAAGTHRREVCLSTKTHGAGNRLSNSVRPLPDKCVGGPNTGVGGVSEGSTQQLEIRPAISAQNVEATEDGGRRVSRNSMPVTMAEL